MRALVISDTHFGAWTGRDLLCEEFFLERLAPQLEGIDELIFLGDLFDFLFGSVGDAIDAADGLLKLIAANMVGKRLVFLAGNHDHHFVHRDAENRLEAQLAAGRSPLLSGERADSGAPGPGYFRSFLARRMPGVEIEIAYPTYGFGGVLCTHGHYLDPHAHLTGSRGDRLLTRVLWGIATGGPEDPKTIEDYESTITLLTEWLYVAAQVPHGTHAQQNVFHAVQRAGRIASTLGLPVRGVRRLAAELRDRGVGGGASQSPLPSEDHFDAVVQAETERQRREQPTPGAAWPHPAYPAASVISPSDPSEHALEAFAKVVANLGWDGEAEAIVFAHTHQPLADVRCGGGSRTRYWNTGSWIYEPDLSSRQAYARYLRYAWPGTAVVIEDEDPEPKLIEILADLNPLNGGAGLPPNAEQG
jgi:UDP-2,3-diacylglucosamine pyrophosphatase LpxH